MKEFVIISGKGGTGKTSLTASLAAVASRHGTLVCADCDVDAADLHLVLAPEVRTEEVFISGRVAQIAPGREGDCAQAAQACRFEAFTETRAGHWTIDAASCEGCGVCVRIAPAGAINFVDRRCGRWFRSDTRFGPLVHAALDIRAENSGKLVTRVRREAKQLATQTGADWILVDGSPGTGCPVIASITGSDAVLVVTEPTVSGMHDLERVASLVRHFAIPFAVCVNKADINTGVTAEISAWCERNAVPFAGSLAYDPAYTRAQIMGVSLVEYCDQQQPDSTIPEQITNIWEKICQLKQ